MVRHGRTKKRRAGRYGKVTLKNRSWSRFDPNPKVDKMLKPHWDPSKSAVLNLQNMGIGQPKGLVEKKEQKDGASDAENNNPCKAIEVFDIPDSDIIIPSRRERFPLNEDEERYIVDCMSKYGDDYTKIFRDTKVNYLQHTEDKLRKMGARFLLLQSQQRRITDFPDKVKTLIEGKGAIK